MNVGFGLVAVVSKESLRAVFGPTVDGDLGGAVRPWVILGYLWFYLKLIIN